MLATCRIALSLPNPPILLSKTLLATFSADTGRYLARLSFLTRLSKPRDRKADHSMDTHSCLTCFLRVIRRGLPISQKALHTGCSIHTDAEESSFAERMDIRFGAGIGRHTRPW